MVPRSRIKSESFGAHTEWDLLKEVVVGRIEGAVVSDEPLPMIQATMPQKYWEFFQKNAGKPFPQAQIDAANKDLETFVHILEAEGVKVRRPDLPGNLFSKPIETAHWKTKGGFYAAMPRDKFLLIGNKIIEAPMSWRSRRNESIPYQTLMKEYESRGAEWIIPSLPQMTEKDYTAGWRYSEDQFQSVITEEEPIFEAADFIRLGKDILALQSHVTNRKGIEWLEKFLGDAYHVHVIDVPNAHRMHIDTTLTLLKPGLLLANPVWVPPSVVAKLKKGILKHWDIVPAPQPVIPDSHPLYMTSKWVSMNVIMIDTERVFVETHDEPLFKLMRNLGLKPIRCPFRNFNTFGGSFHCATIDVWREGSLKSYL
ncbi:MAG: amidinotransferase [Deltaproteobacteria bacterium]|nr:amidinotransferase [Deltaproteobacteria bacterium]